MKKAGENKIKSKSSSEGSRGEIKKIQLKNQAKKKAGKNTVKRSKSSNGESRARKSQNNKQIKQ